jgi:hypothetical protein
MPRQPTAIERDIPLFLIPHVVLREVRTHGEELERLNVHKTRRHFYNVSISTRPIKRELKRVKKYPSGTPEADTREDEEDTGGREGRVDAGGGDAREDREDGGERV